LHFGSGAGTLRIHHSIIHTLPGEGADGEPIMNIRWTTWRRDVLIGLLASLLTASVLVPIGWAAVRDQRDQAEGARKAARDADLRAEQKAAEAEEQRARAGRNLIEQAADFANVPGLADGSGAEVMRVSTAAVSPEIPKDAHLLIDKKASSYAAGDIVIFRVEDRNYLGRVLAVDKEAGRLAVGRNGEADRQIAVSDVIGRGVLNTR
jgi:hypothetical protein